MNTNQFFQSELSHHTILLELIDKRQLSTVRERLNALEINYLDSVSFQGNLGEICFVYHTDARVKKIFIGGNEDDLASTLAAAALALPAGSYQFTQPLSKQALIAWAAAQYTFTRYKNKNRAPRILIADTECITQAVAEADMIYTIRDLINTPANDMNPESLAHFVKTLADTYRAEYQEWSKDALLENNFPAIHAVGRAAHDAPRLIALTWGQPHHPKITIVGKGVCFDSGGLDIKPCEFMRLMKKDMGGAAHAIGLAQWIMSVNLPVYLRVLIPAVENAIGPNAYRPGDVLTMRNGLTVEIDNTDAEGRLVLADALVKACEDEPELLIDFATLTGAARVAVGTDIAALFTNDDALSADLLEAANKTNDPIWRLPLFQAYAPMLDSKIADMVNAGPSYAGAITAALFLERFVKPHISWMHFDIMAWNLKARAGKPEGGEAMAVRAVADYLLQKYPS